jgi:hypothetical protein
VHAVPDGPIRCPSPRWTTNQIPRCPVPSPRRPVASGATPITPIPFCRAAHDAANVRAVAMVVKRLRTVHVVDAIHAAAG